jgi:hypothetical protein
LLPNSARSVRPNTIVCCPGCETGHKAGVNA